MQNVSENPRSFFNNGQLFGDGKATTFVHKLLRHTHQQTVSGSVILLLLFGASATLASAQKITYSSSTTLTGDVFCTDLTINPGVVLTTNGYNLYCTGTVTNNGLIQTGLVGNGGTGANESPAGATGGGSFPNSYGASGGGGGGSAAINLGPAQISGPGGNTLVSGGSGGTEVGGSCGTGGAGNGGSTPSAPSITNTLIQTWYSQGLANFLAGGGGGGGAGSGFLCSDTGGSAGGSGAYGIYIQGNKIVAGAINASGQNGGTGGSGGGGGGGAGSILLAYGAKYVPGTYNINGGGGGAAGPNGGNGGNGGGGQVLPFSYGTTPPAQAALVASPTGQVVALTGSVNFQIVIEWNVPYNGNANGFVGNVTLSVPCSTGIDLSFPSSQGGTTCSGYIAGGVANITLPQPSGGQQNVTLTATTELNAPLNQQINLSICGLPSNSSTLYCTGPQVEVEPLVGLNSQISFSGLSTGISTGILCLSLSSDGECFSVQQNFFIYDPSAPNGFFPSYWVQNIIPVVNVLEGWIATPLVEIFTVDSGGNITSCMVDANFVLQAYPNCIPGAAQLQAAYLVSLEQLNLWTLISSSTGFSPLTQSSTIVANPNGSGDVISFGTSVGQTFVSHLIVSTGSFISAGQAQDESPPFEEPQLALVGLSNGNNVTFGDQTAGAVSSQAQLGQSSATTLQAPFTNKAGCSSTGETSKGLVWSKDGSTFGPSEHKQGEGISFVPGTGGTCP